MKKCYNCNNIIEEDISFCPHCGAKVKSEVQEFYEMNNMRSLFIKYSSYLDNDTLYKVAIAKERGLIKKDFPNEDEEIFKLLAFKGHLDSMYHYANILLAKVPSEKELAYKWLKIAAQARHIPSINLLNTFSFYDDGSAKNVNNSNNKEGIKIDPKVMKTMERIENSRVEIPASCASFTDVVHNVLSSIVMITTLKQVPEGCTIQSGSGFVLGSGFIVTNSHVIQGNPDMIEINFEPGIDDRTYVCYPVIDAPEFDLALLWCENFDPERRMGVVLEQGNVQYGEEVFTIGNPLGIGLSVSKGIVSCPTRETTYPEKVPQVIQTDITINHGNSGGALFNANGKVIGVATFVPSECDGGIGMCIPASYINELVSVLEKNKNNN